MDVAHLGLEHLLTLAAAIGWASGLRLYAVLFCTGLAGAMGWVPLPPGLHVLQQPLVLGAAGLMVLAEFVVDKLPLLDSLWDGLHALVRIPAGAALAAALFGGDQANWALVAALLGGTLAASSQIAKSSTRAAANTSPEPFSNLALSLAGDVAAPGMLWLAWSHPGWAVAALAAAVLTGLVLTVLLIKFLRRLWRGLRQRLGGTAAARP
jgi:hypothetical protein